MYIGDTNSGLQLFWRQGLVSWKTIFPGTGPWGRECWWGDWCFQDDSSALHSSPPSAARPGS